MSAHSVLPALRQAPGTPKPTPATGPAGDGTSEGSGESTLIPFIIVAVVVAVLAATIFLFVLVRILIARRSGRFAAEHVDVAPRGESSRDHIVYAYFPAQAPAVVRMQRLAQSAGLTLQELSEVSPVIPFKRKAGGEEENTCAVCLEEMDADAKTRRMPCGHDFHAKCIEEWVSKANRCPVCNMQIVDEEQLQQKRMAALEGRLVAAPTTGGPRLRRRRARGENGTFQLRDSSAAREAAPEAGDDGAEDEPAPSVAEPAADPLPLGPRRQSEVH